MALEATERCPLEVLKEKRPELHRALVEAAGILNRKAHDYAADADPYSNFRGCEAMGIPAWKGVLVRIGDKFSRLSEFAKKGELHVKDEGAVDTLLDMANYAIICRYLLAEYLDSEAGAPANSPEPGDASRQANEPQGTTAPGTTAPGTTAPEPEHCEAHGELIAGRYDGLLYRTAEGRWFVNAYYKDGDLAVSGPVCDTRQEAFDAVHARLRSLDGEVETGQKSAGDFCPKPETARASGLLDQHVYRYVRDYTEARRAGGNFRRYTFVSWLSNQGDAPDHLPCPHVIADVEDYASYCYDAWQQKAAAMSFRDWLDSERPRSLSALVESLRQQVEEEIAKAVAAILKAIALRDERGEEWSKCRLS